MATTVSTETGSHFGTSTAPDGKLANVLTWIAQAITALVFLFAGSMKFIMSAEEMTKSSPLPLAFIYFIGVCEILGAFGLILPGALKIRRGLTPIAAAGLTIIMIGATVISLRMDPKLAITPFVVGLLTSFITYRRWRWLSA